MKTFFKLFFIIILCLLVACSGYQRFPEKFNHTETLYKSIRPDKKYTYWQVRSGCFGQHTAGFESGMLPKELEIKNQQSGLFYKSGLGGCSFTYIVHVYKGKIGYVTSPLELQDFLGTIDNLEEATLLALATETDLDITDSDKGGSYFIHNGEYNLKLSKIGNCPETVESIYLRVQRDGEIVDRKSFGIFHKTDGCVIE